MAAYSHNDLCLTPIMTSNTAPLPSVVSAVYEVSGHEAYKAFDQTITTEWLTGYGNGAAPWWLKFDLGTGNSEEAISYTVSASENSDHNNRAPKTWTLEGSNNGTDWDVLDTQIDVAAWALGEMREYLIAVSAIYRYYKLDITVGFDTGVNSYVVIGELELLRPHYINSNIATPSMTAEGFTGIDARDVTSPHITAEVFTGITAKPSISMPTVIMTGSDNIEHVQATTSIPMMSASIIQAEQIWGDATIPAIVADLTERETTLGEVTLPMVSAEMTSGAHADLDATISAMIAEGTFSNQCEATLPMITVEIEGKVGRVVSSEVAIPKITVEITGKTEHLANCDVSAPMARANAELITGKIITGIVTIPFMSTALSGYEDIDGDVNVSVPVLEAYMIGTTERESCEVLRYSR